MDSSFHQTERRRLDRSTVQMHALISFGDQRVEGEILNLSKEGTKIRLAKPWNGDRTIEIEIKHFGSCGGLVTWADGNVVGVRFTEEFLLLTLFLGGWYELPH